MEKKKNRCFSPCKLCFQSTLSHFCWNWSESAK